MAIGSVGSRPPAPPSSTSSPATNPLTDPNNAKAITASVGAIVTRMWQTQQQQQQDATKSFTQPKEEDENE